MNPFIEVAEAKLRLNKTQNCGCLLEEEYSLGVTFWGDGNIPYRERGVFYQGVSSCQNSAAKICDFNLCKF